MRCNVKANINAYAALAGGATMDEVRKTVISAKDMIANLSDTSDLVGETNPGPIIAERRKVLNALSSIKQFHEHGLVLVNESNSATRHAVNMMADLITDNSDAVVLLNNLHVANSTDENPLIEDGHTKYSEKYINSLIRRRVGTLGTVSHMTKFVTVDNLGKVTIQKALSQHYNEYLYAKYMDSVAKLAEAGVHNASDEFKDGVSYLKREPVVEHLKKRINAINESIKIASQAGSFSTRVSQLVADRAELERKLASVQSAMTVPELEEYLEDMVKELESLISKPSGLPLETIASMQKSIALISNVASYKNNRILNALEVTKKDLMQRLGVLRSRAEAVGYSLERRQLSALVEDANKIMPNVKTTADNLTIVNNLSSGWQRLTQKVLGLHNIDSHIINYIKKLVDNALVKANLLASEGNNRTEAAYRDFLDAGGDINIFYQRDNGTITGRMTGLFTAKAWRERRKLYAKGGYRKKYGVAINPHLLFEVAQDNPARVKHEQELKEVLRHDYNDWIEDSRSKWESYKQAREAILKSSRSQQAKDNWIAYHNPMKSVDEFSTNNKITSRFINIVHKRTNKLGRDLGFYDAAYDNIRSNDKASKLYDIVKEINLENQMALHHFDEKFKPPKFGYVSSTISESIKNGDWEKAGELTRTLFANSLSPESLAGKRPKIDPLTGEVTYPLKSSLYSVTDKIYDLSTEILEENPRYLELSEKKGLGKLSTEERHEFEQIKKEAKQEAAQQIEKEMSNDFLQSITLNNFATKSLIERKNIEAKIHVAVGLIDTSLRSPGVKDERVDAAVRAATEAVDYFLDIKYYEAGASEKAHGILASDKQAKVAELQAQGKWDEAAKITAYTDRQLGSILLSTVRMLSLGWNVTTSFINVGQALFSNMVEGVDGTYFKLEDLASSYIDVLHEKNRRLIDNLYVVGDIAFEFNRTNIHEEKTLSRFLRPMKLQTVAEKINQGSVAIAVMKGITVKDKNGNEHSLYDVLPETGILDDQYTSDEFPGLTGIDLIVSVVTNKIRPVNMKASGDYLSPLEIEASVLGKAMLVFKKYLPEMWVARLGGTRIDYNTGEEIEGRFISALKVIKNVYNNVESTDGQKRRAYAALAEVLVGYLIKLTMMALSGLACDTPECKEQKPAILYSLNLANRLSDDILTFIHPAYAVKVTENMFAATTTIKNLWTLGDNIISLLPYGNDPHYATDTDEYDEGDWKGWKPLKALTPGYKHWDSAKRMGTKLQKDQTLYDLIKNVNSDDN